MNDPDLIKFLAERAMGWPVYRISAHRPGSRPLPHAWQLPHADRVDLMVYGGGEGPTCNRIWNPLASELDAVELLATQPDASDGADVFTTEGRRDYCITLADSLKDVPPAPAIERNDWFEQAGALIAKQAAAAAPPPPAPLPEPQPDENVSRQAE